ncbi:MAG: hypothetical protein IT483_04205 [Gammaproteobacteria bacterium]|nr:hypothetical protein [Gammaproteobacteria bacterium]
MTVTVSVPPPTALLPLQAPLAVQEVGVLVADQEMTLDAPAASEVGLALIVTTGTGVAAATVTVTLCEAVAPAELLQVSVKVVLAVSAGEDSVPEVARDPVQPPEAVHEAALVDDHVRAVEAPEDTVVGLAERETVGAGVGVVPPSPPPPPQAARVREAASGANLMRLARLEPRERE